MTPRTKGKGGAAKRPAFSTPFKKGHENGVGTLFSLNGKRKERDIPGTASAVKGKGKRVEKEYRKVFDLTRELGSTLVSFLFLVVSRADPFLLGYLDYTQLRKDDSRWRPPTFDQSSTLLKNFETWTCASSPFFPLSPSLPLPALADLALLLFDTFSPEEIWEINSSNAAYYSFCDTTDRTRNLDHSIALVELTAAGCEGLTPAWVENHWALVLWKLACLVRSKPSFFQEEKFSWEEMLKQLKYRFVVLSSFLVLVARCPSLTRLLLVRVSHLDTNENTTKVIALPSNESKNKTRPLPSRWSSASLRSSGSRLPFPTSVLGTLLQLEQCSLRWNSRMDGTGSRRRPTRFCRVR